MGSMGPTGFAPTKACSASTVYVTMFDFSGTILDSRIFYVGNLLSAAELVCCRVQLGWNSVAGVAHGIFQDQRLFVLTSLINL